MKPAVVVAAFLAIGCCRTAASLSLGARRDESNCTLVSKRGLLLTSDVRPSKPASDTSVLSRRRQTALAELGMSHYVEDIRRRGDGASVYVVTSALQAFVSEVLPQVSTRFKLVTGDSVRTPTAVLGEQGVLDLAGDPRLIKWFAQNCADGEEVQPKVVPVPVGLDYHTMAERVETPWFVPKGPPVSPEDQERTLLQKSSASRPFERRLPKVYFGGSTSSSRRARIISKFLKQRDLVSVEYNSRSREDFWDRLGRHKFAASPPGEGVDCHRTWEVIAMGGIPLVDSRLHALYQRNGFNVVQLEDDEWGELAGEAVQRKFEEAAARHVQKLPEAMYLKYWVDMIDSAT